MTTDFRALCDKLLAVFDRYDDESNMGGVCQDELNLLSEARAALAQDQQRPTDYELLATVRHLYQNQRAADMAAEDDIRTARAVLARWGGAAPQPVPVTERLPVAKDCDEQGRCWWWYPPEPEKTYGYWAHEDDAVPERAIDEQPTHWLPANALPLPEVEG